MNKTPAIAELIADAQKGDEDAQEKIFRVLYDDLHALASARLSANGSEGLDTKALVHESYLRFVQTGNLKLEDEPDFVNYAGRVLQSVIVDVAR